MRLLAAFLLLAPAALAQTPAYTVGASIPLGPPDHWDYLTYDPGTRRVLVAHGDRVTIVDPDAAAVIGDVEIGAGAHGVVVVGKTGYAASGETSRVSVFDVAQRAVEASVATAHDADALAHDPVSNRVVSVNGDSGSVTIIDPRNRQATGTLDLGGELESAAPDGAGRILVAGAEKREVIVIDPAAAAVVARWPVPECVSPHGLAAEPGTHRALVTCIDGHAMLLDTGSGAVVATLEIGRGSDAAAWDEHGHRFLSSNNDGTLDVIGIDADGAPRPLPRVTTRPGARTLAVAPDGRAFTVTADPDGPPAANGRYRFKPGTVHLLVLDPAP